MTQYWGHIEDRYSEVSHVSFISRLSIFHKHEVQGRRFFEVGTGVLVFNLCLHLKSNEYLQISNVRTQATFAELSLYQTGLLL